MNIMASKPPQQVQLMAKERQVEQRQALLELDQGRS